MNLSFFIARRYLFSKKGHSAINVISVISMIGVALSTCALICVLSVFNGFHDLVATLFTAIDPQLELVSADKQTFSQNDKVVEKLKSLDDVDEISLVLENKALARYSGNQIMIKLKGVDDNFSKCTDMESILYGNKKMVLHADVLNYAIPGYRVALYLGLTTDFIDPLEIYAPRGGERINMMDPSESFSQDELNSSGSVFNSNKKEYDAEYVFCSLQFAQKIFEKQGEISSISIKLKKGSSISFAKHRIQSIVGDNFKVLDRYEQQADVFSIMKVEKLMAFIFLTFILFIACFNIIASLSMLMIDKRNDVKTLYNIGCPTKTIQSIFSMEGRLISIGGALLGLMLGLGLCYAQMEFGLLRLGEQSGTFIVDAYPVSVSWIDVAIVIVTVLVVSFLSSWFPVRYLSNRLINK